MDKELFISICLPVLNGEKTIYQTLKSLLSQNYQNFEIVVSNNCSIDNTIKIINSFNDIRIKLHNTKTLISCGENIINSIKKSNSEIIVFSCADDLFDKNYLNKINKIYKLSNIGAVLRNYTWFNDKELKPNRIRFQLREDKILSLSRRNLINKSDFETILSIDQLSGISLKKSLIDYNEFHKFSFIETASLLLPIMKKKDLYVIGHPYIAIRIHDKNGASNPESFKQSPTKLWFLIFDKYLGKSNSNIFKLTFGKAFESLVQIRIFGGYNFFFREIFYFLKYNKSSILSFKFFFYISVCLLPKNIIIKIKDNYKKYKSNQLRNYKINFLK